GLLIRRGVSQCPPRAAPRLHAAWIPEPAFRSRQPLSVPPQNRPPAIPECAREACFVQTRSSATAPAIGFARFPDPAVSDPVVIPVRHDVCQAHPPVVLQFRGAGSLEPVFRSTKQSLAPRRFSLCATPESGLRACFVPHPNSAVAPAVL